MDHLDELESQSIYILREAYHSFSNLCMPWSMGKDSNVLIWLSKKAFCGKIPIRRCTSIRRTSFPRCWSSATGLATTTIST